MHHYVEFKQGAIYKNSHATANSNGWSLTFQRSMYFLKGNENITEDISFSVKYHPYCTDYAYVVNIQITLCDTDNIDTHNSKFLFIYEGNECFKYVDLKSKFQKHSFIIVKTKLDYWKVKK